MAPMTNSQTPTIDYLALCEGTRDIIVSAVDAANVIALTGVLGLSAPAAVETSRVEAIRSAKLLVGIGNGTYRGVTFYEAWADENGAVRSLVEIALSGFESPWQVAGTMTHELGHVLAGLGSQHGPAWKAAAAFLGLRKPRQAGQRYYAVTLAPTLRARVADLVANLTGERPNFTPRGDRYGTGFAPVSGGCKFGHKVPTSRATGPRVTYACECGTRITSDDDVSALVCTTCDQNFAPVSNGKRGRPRKEATA